ncbi:MAG: hypothetical protein AAGC55_17350, partial [Myxococcota bacterium]
MSAHEKELHPDEKVKAKKLASKIFKGAIPIGVVALIIAAVIGIAKGDHMHRFYFSYLTALAFCLSISVGALFFVIIQPLVRAYWSVTVRRIAEILTSAFPLLGVLTLVILAPMLMGGEGPYHWADEALHDHNNPKFDSIVYGKSAWLNTPFFVARIVIYFVIYSLMARYFFKKSVEQDETGDASITDHLRAVSGPSVLVFALVTCFAAFDLLMSLSPHWFSTIFGVYYFAGSAVAIFASLVLIGVFLQRKGRLVHSITIEHYHDVGKFLFAFVFFWSYIAFSQFML